MKDTHITHDQGLYVRFLTSIKTTSEVAVNFYQFLSSLGPVPWFGVDNAYKIPCDYVPLLLSSSNLRDDSYLNDLYNKVCEESKTQFNPRDLFFWDTIGILRNKRLCGFDVQNGKIIAYATINPTTSEVEAASQGLLKISYTLDSQSCSLNLIIPVLEREKLLNVFILLMHARIVDGIKFTPKIIKYLSPQDSIDFDIHLDHSYQLGSFLDALQEAYKPKDISKKYATEPKVREHIETLKTLDKTLREKSYHHLCAYANTLNPSA